MRLPEGVHMYPRQDKLIDIEKKAIISIDKRIVNNRGYQINDRSFENAISPYLQGDWDRVNRLFHLSRYVGSESTVYSGAEYRSSISGINLKLPNITVVPNFPTTENRGLSSPIVVLGCTMGHFHPHDPDGFRIQEVYEFLSNGLLVIDYEGGRIELWVAQQGDKVSVPVGCHMTLYNLGDADDPLITLDFANPERNPANKELIKRCGPILLAFYDDAEIVFTLNHLYINNSNHNAGVRLMEAPVEDSARQIRIARGARLNLGQFLYEELTGNPEVIGRFARLGISIKQATPEVTLPQQGNIEGLALQFMTPLADITRKSTEVYRYFFPNAQPNVPPPSKPWLMKHSSQVATAEPVWEASMETTLSRPLTIVVEGAGDWVEKAYRDLFRRKMARNTTNVGKKSKKKDYHKLTHEIAVFYADDSRWKGLPNWSDTQNLESWEVYLDKADSQDFARYQLLRPDVVFVVTPDFTHSATAEHWLGKAPMIFVEKPFDSHFENIDKLAHMIGQSTIKNTNIRGLDHYQFYALPVTTMKSEIMTHLGGALKQVEFFLAEKNSIESGRMKSLQYGLTLDMLPHLIALLTYFGSIQTIDEIKVLDARQYTPIEEGYRNETASHVCFTFLDDSGNGYRVPCHAVVGKGFSEDVKYLEITGVSGRAIRIDMNKQKKDDAENSIYPKDSLIFLGDPDKDRHMRQLLDPYRPGQTLYLAGDHHRLERTRYEKLIEDILSGMNFTVASSLSVAQSLEIVRVLDRIWWAIQGVRPFWKKYPQQKLHPVNYAAKNSV